jgi:hypothetical protein
MGAFYHLCGEGNIYYENWNIPLLSLYDCDIEVAYINTSKGSMHLACQRTSEEWSVMNAEQIELCFSCDE